MALAPRRKAVVAAGQSEARTENETKKKVAATTGGDTKRQLDE